MWHLLHFKNLLFFLQLLNLSIPPRNSESYRTNLFCNKNSSYYNSDSFLDIHHMLLLNHTIFSYVPSHQMYLNWLIHLKNHLNVTKWCWLIVQTSTKRQSCIFIYDIWYNMWSVVKYILASFINKYKQRNKWIKWKVFNQKMSHDNYKHCWEKGIFGGFFIFGYEVFFWSHLYHVQISLWRGKLFIL